MIDRNPPDLLPKLIGLTNAEYKDRNYHIDCPNCDKAPKGKASYGHFSFNGKGGHCFACGYNCSLAGLYQHVTGSTYRATPESSVLSHPAQPEQGLRSWQKSPEKYLARYTAAADRVTFWQAYRPLTLATIAAYQLGVGILPSCACKHKRLILPLFENGKIVGFRGRAVECDCDKWLQAAGSKTMLFGADKLRPGCTAVVIESPADCVYGSQEEPDYVIMASTCGVRTWEDEWTALLKQCKQVLIWFDNDLAGDPNKETLDRLTAEWKAAHQKGKPPQPFGPMLQARLRKAGILAGRNTWPDGTPDKADFGWKLMLDKA